MKNLLLYNDFIKEAYDSFHSRIKTYGGSIRHAHRVATKLGYFTNLFKSLTPEEMVVVEWYRDSGYREIAENLYGGKKKDKVDVYLEDGKIKKLSFDLLVLKFEDIINKSIIKKDIVLWKGLRDIMELKTTSLKNIIKNMNLGDTYTFKNFLSTSLNFQYSLFSFAYHRHSDSIILKINVPSGTKGAYISHDMTENEVVLQRNQTMKLKDIYDYDIGNHFPSHRGTILKIYEFDII